MEITKNPRYAIYLQVSDKKDLFVQDEKFPSAEIKYVRVVVEDRKNDTVMTHAPIKLPKEATNALIMELE